MPHNRCRDSGIFLVHFTMIWELSSRKHKPRKHQSVVNTVILSPTTAPHIKVSCIQINSNKITTIKHLIIIALSSWDQLNPINRFAQMYVVTTCTRLLVNSAKAIPFRPKTFKPTTIRSMRNTWWEHSTHAIIFGLFLAVATNDNGQEITRQTHPTRHHRINSTASINASE